MAAQRGDAHVLACEGWAAGCGDLLGRSRRRVGRTARGDDQRDRAAEHDTPITGHDWGATALAADWSSTSNQRIPRYSSAIRKGVPPGTHITPAAISWSASRLKPPLGAGYAYSGCVAYAMTMASPQLTNIPIMTTTPRPSSESRPVACSGLITWSQNNNPTTRNVRCSRSCTESILSVAL